MSNFRAKKLPILVVTVLAQAWVANGQTVDESFRSDIRKLLDVTGSAQLAMQAASLVSGQLVDVLKQSQPSLPDRALELIKQVLDSEYAKGFEGPDGLTEQMVSIYASHFTQEDVRGLLAFYTSDLVFPSPVNNRMLLVDPEQPPLSRSTPSSSSTQKADES